MLQIIDLVRDFVLEIVINVVAMFSERGVAMCGLTIENTINF